MPKGPPARPSSLQTREQPKAQQELNATATYEPRPKLGPQDAEASSPRRTIRSSAPSPLQTQPHGF
ncbi:hypothetical protein BD779DRAFT_1572934 [Infundibulicybe gibba]|nr:hypothetical protein BD779DRAFT_1572934 [Infundibulicybe gibba]